MFQPCIDGWDITFLLYQYGFYTLVRMIQTNAETIRRWIKSSTDRKLKVRCFRPLWSNVFQSGPWFCLYLEAEMPRRRYVILPPPFTLFHWTTVGGGNRPRTIAMQCKNVHVCSFHWLAQSHTLIALEIGGARVGVRTRACDWGLTWTRHSFTTPVPHNSKATKKQIDLSKSSMPYS